MHGLPRLKESGRARQASSGLKSLAGFLERLIAPLTKGTSIEPTQGRFQSRARRRSSQGKLTAICRAYCRLAVSMDRITLREVGINDTLNVEFRPALAGGTYSLSNLGSHTRSKSFSAAGCSLERRVRCREGRSAAKHAIEIASTVAKNAPMPRPIT